MSGPTRARPPDPETGVRATRRPPAPEPLPSPVVDNHCHLDIRDGDDWMDPSEALERSMP